MRHGRRVQGNENGVLVGMQKKNDGRAMCLDARLSAHLGVHPRLRLDVRPGLNPPMRPTEGMPLSRVLREAERGSVVGHGRQGQGSKNIRGGCTKKLGTVLGFC